MWHDYTLSVAYNRFVQDPPSKAYGQGRMRTSVSYGEVERAATMILKAERRPTVETVREALGRGSNETIGAALRRFWRDLGVRIEGDPAALTRIPAEIADLTDVIWQRALKLAGEAAKNDDNAARERLNQIRLENELRAQSFVLREKEWDTIARERERALSDSRDHLLSVMKTLGRAQADLRARDIRIIDLGSAIEQYRRQVAGLIAAAIAKNRGPTQRKAPNALPGLRRTHQPPPHKPGSATLSRAARKGSSMHKSKQPSKVPRRRR
jgi:hypothetical protein